MSLTDFLRTVLVRRRAVSLSVFLVFVIVAAVIISVLPKRYEASASLFVGQDRPISASGSAQRDDVLAKSYAQLLGAPEVAEQAAKTVGGGLSRADLEARMSFLVTPGTQLIAVTASDGDPRRAAELATVYAETFVAQRQRADARLRTARLDRLDEDIRAQSREVQRLSAGGASGGEVDDARARLRSLRDTFQALDESLVLEGSNLSLATRAVAPTAAAAPQPVLYMAAAVLLGLFLACGAALALDRADRRVWSEEELQRIAGAPILARIPRFLDDGDVFSGAAFDFLSTNLRNRSDTHSILITSPTGNNGKTTVVLGLANSLAAMGQSVVAADCDFRNPTLSRTVPASTAPGLKAVAAGTASIGDAVLSSDRPALKIAVAEDDGAATRLGIDGARRLVAALETHADVVVIDSAPITAAFETSVLAAAGVDAVLLVVDLRTAREDAVKAALDQLARSGTELTGIVVNRARTTHTFDYGYGSDRNGHSRTRPFAKR